MQLVKAVQVMLLIAVGSVAMPASFAADQTPEEVAAAYFRDLSRDGLAAAGQYMAPSELVRFRSMLMPIFEEGFRSAKDSPMLSAFTRGDSLQQVQDYSAREFFERAMLWMGTLNPGMDAILRQARSKPLGHVREGEVAHVVLRTVAQVSGATASKVSVVSFRTEQGEWRMLLAGDIENMATMLRNQAGRR